MSRQTGGCQCGAVRFEVDCTLDHAITCNCSRCQKLGSVLVFAPQSAFTLLSGQEALTEYLFNKRKISHRFCRVCGIECFAYATAPDGREMVAININTLDGVEPRAVPATAFDGRSK